MTLFKQIALVIGVILFVLLTTIVVNDLERTSKFQQGQLQTTAQDMATTLGITISNLPDGNDPATLEVLFNAVFDSGYYSHIKLTGIDQRVIHVKSRALKVEGVPDWFIQRVTLKPARGETQVMKGWSQLGLLSLEIHPGYAYRNLYDNLISTIQGFAILLGISTITLWLLLRYILAPLRLVREQAEAIHQNRFVQQQKIPGTTELKRVVEAMNLMVSKVQSIFDDQEKNLQNYQQMLYRDGLTGLGNKRYMLDQLKQSLTDGEGRYNCMAIVKIVEFDRLRDQHGYEAADDLVRILADLLRQPHAGHSIERLSRFNDDEFAFLSTEADTVVDDFLRGLFDSFQQLIHSQAEIQGVKLQAGICEMEPDSMPGNLLASIDYCLSKAQSRGPFNIERRLSTGFDLPQGKMQWRSWIEDKLQNQHFFLVAQPITRGTKSIQQELFIRARGQQEQTIPASAFMPMATSLGMSYEIDREVFRLVSEITTLDHNIPLALNLSAAFFDQADALEELVRFLDNCVRTHRQICIEASHHILLQHPLICARISAQLRQRDFQLGIDNLDFGLPMQILQSGQFDYIKINANTLHDPGREEIRSAYRALHTITDTMDISIIAVGIESQELVDELETLGIHSLQGNFIADPVPI